MNCATNLSHAIVDKRHGRTEGNYVINKIIYLVVFFVVISSKIDIDYSFFIEYISSKFKLVPHYKYDFA